MMSSSFTEGARAEIRRHASASPWTFPMLERRQREVAERVAGGESGALLLSELSPVITVGRRASPADLLFPSDFYSKAGIEICAVDRGGLATWHGPGQWVLFVVEKLEKIVGDPRGVRKAVCFLLEIAREVSAPYIPDLTIREGAELGLWSPRGKLAAVGIQVKDGILLHGLSLNVMRTEKSFFGLRPCGLDLPVDFLLHGQDATKNEAEFLNTGDSLVRAANRAF